MTTDIEAIVQCLRFESKVWREQVGEVPIFGDAADALEAVAAERDEARADADRRLRNLELAVAERDDLRAAIDDALDLIQPSRLMPTTEIGYVASTRDVVGARRILSRATTTEKGTEA